MLTIGDFNSFWVFLGHPVVKSPKNVPIVSVTIILQSNNMALRLLSD